LTAAGFTTDIAADGEIAYSLATTGRYDLLILDLGLPQKDGFDVLRDLRGQGHQIPIVILTARGQRA
jgi:DNA-binding response OmpR family regulator